MDHNHQAGKNFAWLSIGQLGTRVLGAAFFFFLSYKLKEIGLGQYSFVSSFVPFWFLLVDFGGAGYLYREWARGTKEPHLVEKDFSELFTLRLLIVSVVFVPFIVSNYFVNKDVLPSMVVFYLAMFVSMFTNLADLYSQSRNLYRFIATRQLIEKLTSVIIGVVLLVIWPSIFMVFMAVLISQLVSVFYIYKKSIKFKIRLIFSLPQAKLLILNGLPFLFLGIFTSLYSRIDMTMLRYMDGFQSAGYYGAAYKFMDLTYVFASLFMSSTFPLLSHLWATEENKQKFNEFFKQSFRILFATGFLGAIALIVVAPYLIGWFFPDSFGPAVRGIRILALGQALAFISSLFSSLLIIQKKEKTGLWIIMLCAGFNVLLNFILIPRYSLYGAAWATVIAEGLNLYLLQRFTNWDRKSSLFIKSALMVLLNAALFTLLKYINLTNNIYIGVGVVLTDILVFFREKLLRKEDITLFLNPFINKLRSVRADNS
jgi:O-antigen/teichoic acid export membrane protein